MPYRILTILFVLFTAFFLIRVFQGLLLGLSYPKELYELSNINLTDALLGGKTPYRLANIAPAGVEPPVCYVYPFLNSFAAAFVSLFTGGDTVLAHYIVSYLAMIGSGLLAGWIVLKFSRTTIGPTLAFLAVMFCHWRYGYTSAAPDGLGILIVLVILTIAVSERIRHKAPWCALFTVAAFYTKQYFAFVCVSVFVYFLITQRKEAGKYFLWCLLITAASFGVTILWWPLFWDYTIPFMLFTSNTASGNAGADTGGMRYVFEQLWYLSQIFAGLYLAGIVAFLLTIRKRQNDGVTYQPTAALLFALQIPVQLLVLLYFGRHDGAYLTYFLQLLYPSVIILALILVERMDVEGLKNWFVIAYAALCVFTIYFGWKKLPLHLLTQEEIGTWQQAYTLMDEYRQDGEIFNTYATAFHGVKCGDSRFYTAHEGHGVHEKRYRQWQQDQLMKNLFPHAGLLYEEYGNYYEYTLERVKKKEYALITQPRDGSRNIPDDLLLSSGYEIVAEFDLQVGNMNYPTVFWAPR